MGKTHRQLRASVVQEQELFSVVFFCWVCRFVPWRRQATGGTAVLGLVSVWWLVADPVQVGKSQAATPHLPMSRIPSGGEFDMPVCGSTVSNSWQSSAAFQFANQSGRANRKLPSPPRFHTSDSSSTPQPYHMLRRSALSLARVARRPYSAMASQTPVEDTIREKVGPLYTTPQVFVLA